MKWLKCGFLLKAKSCNFHYSKRNSIKFECLYKWIKSFTAQPTSVRTAKFRLTTLIFFYQQMHFYLTHKMLIIRIHTKTLFYSHSYVFRSVRARPATQHTHTHTHTHHNLKHMLPQYCDHYNDVILLILSTKSNFGQAQYTLPDDGPHGPKHVGVTVKSVLM